MSGTQPFPAILQQLLDLGLIEAELENANGEEIKAEFQSVGLTISPPALHSRVLNFGGTTLADPTGSLGPKVPAKKKTAPPQQQPSYFWKAMGFFLKTHYSASGGLSGVQKAVFFAEPNQAAIAGEITRPAQVTNYHVFLFSDSMQRANQPSFSLSGSSYFEFLNLYLRYVGDENETEEVVQARNALVTAKRRKDEAWEAARKQYIMMSESANAVGTTKAISLIDYIEKEPKYQKAWEDEKSAQAGLDQLLSPDMASVAGQLNMIRMADMRLEYQRGNNMQVIAIDADWNALGKKEGKPVDDLIDEKNIYYRPSQELINYHRVVNTWYENLGSSRLERDGPYSIPLAGIYDRKWAELGHPLLDQAAPPAGGKELTEEQKKFLDSLTLTLTYIQEPFVGDISRGMWDVPDVRARFPDDQLRPEAPDFLREPVYKTTKLIIAWGVEIELIVPGILPQDLVNVKQITLNGLDLPFKRDGGDGNKLVFKGGGRYPILLGAFANMI